MVRRTKRTTKSTGKGSRTTTTKTVTSKGNTNHTTSRSTGSKGYRFTSSTNINSGKPTKHYVTRTIDGWRTTTLLNPAPKKPKKNKVYRPKKSKSTIKFSTIMWGIGILYVLAILTK